jgi:adenylate cyclase
MSPAERQVLRRVGAPDNVRLACQLRPTHDVGVAPLLPPDVKPAQSLPHADALSGREQDVTVLFADLRGFTRLAERKLPYDVVFLLNRYFESVGESITRAGGMPNQFTGDGVMALFGVNTSPEEGSRRALVAAGDIVRALATLSQSLAEELPAPLRIGIGIHTGPAVVGRMGYGETVYLTAVGDTVHVASRLQELTKQYACLLVISEQVAARAGVDVSRYPRHELTVRNRTEPLAVRVIDDDLAGVIPGRGDPSPIAPIPQPRA